MSVRVDNFCSPFGQLRVERCDDTAHLSTKIRALGVVAGHFDRFLPQRIGDRPFIATALAKDDGHSVPQAVKRYSGANAPFLLKMDAQGAP